LAQLTRPCAAEVTVAHERLARAVRAAQVALGAEREPGAQLRSVLDRLGRCAGALDSLDPGGTLDALELRGLAIKRGNLKALRGGVFDELERAHSACLELCGRDRAVADLGLLGELLEGYGRRYAERKAERSALDYDDLELWARDLLVRHPALRERVRGRFAHVLVDELQDTNRLQNEIVDLVTDGNLFTVGDELQSIYGFRGAEVGVFAARREDALAGGREVRLTANFRSRAEVLDALDVAFAPVFGKGFTPLRAPDEHARGASVGPPRVELLAVDRDNGRWNEVLAPGDKPFGAALAGTPPWRAAEARALARRIDELLADGEFAAGEVAVLLRSWSDVARYEQAIAQHGVATYVAGGGGLWSAQQVTDLRAYLAALANPEDEEPLVSTLASPLVGVSLDALALLRVRAGRRRGLWSTVVAAFGDGEDAPGGETIETEELAAALPAADRARLGAFVPWLLAERREAPRRSLAALVERAVSVSGYDRAVLAMPGGERRMANVRKLKRLAREYEAAEGRNLRGFLDALGRREVTAAREAEAPLEGEGLDAVRLMTIHAAKGLEFPLVCVADLGRGEPRDSAVLRLSADGRVGLRLADPDGGPGLDVLDAPQLAEEAARAEREEERRLLWVAATRAERRLIVSGALDVEKIGSGRGCGPMDWLATALVPELPEAAEKGRRAGVCRRPWDGRQARVAWRLIVPEAVEEELAAEDCVPTGGEPHPDRAPAPAAVMGTGVVSSPAPALSRISYSALDSHRRCGYRFYLERILRLPVTRELPPARAARGSLDALTRGTIVHELLEEADLSRSTPPTEGQMCARLAAHAAPATPGNLEDLRGLLAGFLGSSLRERMAGARRVRRELPFAFALAADHEDEGARMPLVEGVIDAYCREVDGALVVDYKSDRLAAGQDLEALCDEAYSTQRMVYALAALRAGADRVDVAHVFLERPDEPVLARYEAHERGDLERRLATLVSDVRVGRFLPSPDPHAGLCTGCPGRAALCSWPRERTGAAAP
ncbi:MAG: UvrD-helicase domain-containing protein, partial [Thermoleophilaceae bacterium]|nr:UvrD-helicase domain-containing protein [Thermoleophilaceae bacterium]